MEFIKAYSRSALILLIVFLCMLILLINGVIYFGMDYLLMNPDLFNNDFLNYGLINSHLINLEQPFSGEDTIRFLQAIIKIYFLPCTLFIFLISAVAICFFLKNSLKNAAKKFNILENNTTTVKQAVAQVSATDKKIKEQTERRMFLHLFSVFQKEGRLLDFFSEDLTLYEDEQIGVAVRSIQESCKKSINKYLAPRPIMDSEEGEDVTVEENFDPDAIKLTGNVTGDPPFKGVLRHKGWKVSNYELPKLGGKQDSTIISQAEVEIV